MAVPSYTTDLVTLAPCSGETWVEPTATDWTDLFTLYLGDADNAIQDGKSNTAIAKVGVGGLLYDATSVTIPTDGGFLIWQYFAAPGCLDTQANGGIRLMCGSSTADFYAWKMGGKNTYAYGGWQNLAAGDPTQLVGTPGSADYTVGSPSSTRRYFGWAYKALTVPAKGTPFTVDVLRYGRCEAIFSGGEAANYCTFPGFAAVNDLSGNRWGLIQSIAGGYLWKGKMNLGLSGIVDFRDANTSVVVANTEKVTSNFNFIEIGNASSRVDWNAISFTSLGTVSRGNLQVTNNADVNIDACTFTDMGTFIFAPNSTINTSTFRRTGTITQSGATLSGCVFANCRDAITISSDAPDLVSDSEFVSDGSNHAIEITTLGASAAYTITNLTYTGYAAPPSGSSGNECIYNNSGQHVKLSINGGEEPSYRNGSGATTEIVLNQVPLTITVKDQNNDAIPSASCSIYKSADDTQLMNEVADASGAATEMFTYSSDTPVYWRVRKSTETSGTRYTPVGGNATVTSAGLSITVTLYSEPLA
jgi:hypothetical protein